jgi:hypothetical protein
MGRGWYLTKVSSDKELIENIADDLRVAGFDVSVREVGMASNFTCPLRTLRGF